MKLRSAVSLGLPASSTGLKLAGAAVRPEKLRTARTRDRLTRANSLPMWPMAEAGVAIPPGRRHLGLVPGGPPPAAFDHGMWPRRRG